MFLHNKTIGELPDQLIQKDDILPSVLQSLSTIWARERLKVRRWCILLKPLWFLTPVERSYLAFVNAQGKFNLMIFIINHDWEEGWESEL